MPRRMELTLACGPYDRTLALRTGEVVPEGIRLTYVALPPEEIFWRQFQHQEFEVSEMSMSSYAITVSRGQSPFVAAAPQTGTMPMGEPAWSRQL